MYDTAVECVCAAVYVGSTLGVWNGSCGWRRVEASVAEQSTAVPLQPNLTFSVSVCAKPESHWVSSGGSSPLAAHMLCSDSARGWIMSLQHWSSHPQPLLAPTAGMWHNLFHTQHWGQGFSISAHILSVFLLQTEGTRFKYTFHWAYDPLAPYTRYNPTFTTLQQK